MSDFPFTGATATVVGWGSYDAISFVGTWAAGDNWTIFGVGTLEGNFTVGAGNLKDAVYNTLLTFGNRVYIGNGINLTFSENDDPTLWEEQSPGAGNIPLLSQYGSQDQVFGLASFQGRLAVFLRQSVQVWVVDADPANFSRAQVLSNIGTMAPLSVQSLGDYDVMFLDDSGVRSLRTREGVLNAFSVDLGTPVDSLVKAAMSAGTPANACAIVEPATKNYWLAIGSTIFVFSSVPSSKIAAWSTFVTSEVAQGAAVDSDIGVYSDTYTDSYSDLTVGAMYHWTPGANELVFVCGEVGLDTAGYFVATESSAFVVGKAGIILPGAENKGVLKTTTQTGFVAEKFVINGGLVYVRGTNGKIYVYGGADGNTYDSAVVTVQTPWLDDKTPATNKFSASINAALAGNWTLSVCMDPAEGTFREVYTVPSAQTVAADDSVFDIGRVPFEAQGTHFAFKAVASSATRCVLSSLIFHYNKGEV